MGHSSIIPIDLYFQGRPLAIAVYAFIHKNGVALFESGPGSTINSLESSLKSMGFGLNDISHIFLTHIHLDHAGAAGYLSTQGAQIFVHPNGASHLINPEKLIASATRIYGENMDKLWGQMNPVLPERLTVLQDDEITEIDKVKIRAIHTPGHAEHHNCYQFEDLVFTGDVGGIRIPGFPYLQVPMPPPEFNLEKWRETILKLKNEKFSRIAPTHFGIYEDVEWHLNTLLAKLNNVESWMEKYLPGNPSGDSMKEKFGEWMNEEERLEGLSPAVLESFGLANPIGMSVDGMMRYWRKYRSALQ